MKINRKNLPALIGFPLLFLSLIAVTIIFWEPLLAIFRNPEQMKIWVKARGLWAPLIFIALQVLQVVVFIIPGEVPQVAGGYLFGVFQGVLYSLIGIGLGSAINFLLARWLGIPFVKLFFKKEQILKFGTLTSTPRAKMVVFMIFLIPGIPKDIMTYVVGLSPIRFFPFLLISSLGRLPGIIGSAIMGDAVTDRNWGLLITIFVIATLLFALGFFLKEPIFKLLKNRVGARKEKE